MTWSGSPREERSVYTATFSPYLRFLKLSKSFNTVQQAVYTVTPWDLSALLTFLMGKTDEHSSKKTISNIKWNPKENLIRANFAAWTGEGSIALAFLLLHGTGQLPTSLLLPYRWRWVLRLPYSLILDKVPLYLDFTPIRLTATHILFRVVSEHCPSRLGTNKMSDPTRQIYKMVSISFFPLL